MNLELITNKVIALCKTTGSFIRQEAQKIKSGDIEEKGPHNFVTYVDRHSEKLLVDGLSGILPGSGFLAEEGHYGDTNHPFRWIIDPLDGTTNFIHGLPIYSISVALQEDEVTILGVVYEINRDECFYSWAGSPAYLNGKLIHVSSASSLPDSLLVTGFPYVHDADLDKFTDLLNTFIRQTHGIRRLGSAAADLGYVACGRFEGFYEYGLNPWDVAAGALIVRNAGGMVTDFKGEDNYLFGRELMASNSHIHSAMLDIIHRHFG